MSDLEDLLTRELADVAGSVHAPRVDALGVRRVAARERRRHHVTAAAVAAVVVVVALASALLPRPGGGDVEPAGGLDALPLGADLALPWADGDGTVHLPGGRTLQLDGPLSLGYRGGTTIVAQGSPGTLTWSVVVDVGAEPALSTLTRRAVGSPTVAVDGSRVAWAEDAPGRSRSQALVVHVLDVASGTTTAVTVVREPGTPALVGVTDVDDRGRVLVGRRDGPPLMSGPDGVVEVAGARDVLALLTDGRAVAYAPEDPAELVDVADDGGTTAVAPLAAGDVTSPAPDAATYVVASGGGRRLEPVSLAGDGRSTPRGALPLPTGEGQQWLVVGWESPTDLVADDVRTPGWSGLVRCSVTAGTCERVADGPWATVGGW